MATDTGDPTIRERLTAGLSWAPARIMVKYAAHYGARARGEGLRLTGRLPEVANIYAASCPKSGSQWIKAVLHHPVVRARTGLFTLPQFDYWQRELPAFPLATFVPGVYLSYPAYQSVPKPASYRTVYIFRDPRDIVVSGYFSGLETHPEMLGLEQRRRDLEQMSVSDGLLYALEYGEAHLQDMATWVGVDEADENVAAWRLEDISADPATVVPQILAHCGVTLSDSELAVVLAETSREALQRKDLAARKPGSESHYRVRRQGFRELFGPEHYAAVERVVPGLVAELGYPD
jgi:hypothetical protein